MPRRARADALRIIPTRVGTRSRSRSGTARRKDHPHACGDKMDVWILCASRLGSSPRVWGQASLLTSTRFSGGIIPTRVGTSNRCCHLFPTLWDHPHACGDKSIELNSYLAYVGSSPRVWGQVSRYVDNRNFIRIIPTRVGTSTICCGFRFPSWDHPHACGDKKERYQLVNVL